MHVIGSARDMWCVRCGSISAYVWVNGICQFCPWIRKLSTGSRDDSPRRVDSPSWQLTLPGLSSDTIKRHSNCLPANCEFALHWSGSFGLGEPKSNACNKSPVYQHPVLGRQQKTHVPISYLFFTSTEQMINKCWFVMAPGIALRDDWLCLLL